MDTVLIRPVASAQLVFGLEWLPLISGRATNAARRIARQRRATHIVLDGASPAAFGFGRVRAGRRSKATLYSAAQIMARLYPTGSVAAILSIDPDAHWLVAIQEGAVMTRTDRIFGTYDQAVDALNVLQQTNRRLVALVDAAVPTLQEIAGAGHSETKLQSTGYWSRKWMIRLALIGLALFGLASLKEMIAPSAVPVRPALDAIEASALWMQAQAKVEQRIVIHGVSATHAVLGHLYEVPVQLGGWVLTRIHCNARASVWHCVADFDRKYRDATNQSLLEVAPSHWGLSFSGMDRVAAAWTFTKELPGPQQWQIREATYNQRYVQSAWQGIKPAFTRMSLGPAQLLPMEAPVGPDGLALMRPTGLPTYARRPVEFQSPLRSLSVLLPYTHAIGWRTISLTLSDDVQPSLTASRLKVTLHGDLYERHKPSPILE